MSAGLWVCAWRSMRIDMLEQNGGSIIGRTGGENVVRKVV